MLECKLYFFVYLVGVNRNRVESACREFCGVQSWQNGTRCRDGVKVGFEGSFPTCACFHSESFFVTSSCFFFNFVF